MQLGCQVEPCRTSIKLAADTVDHLAAFPTCLGLKFPGSGGGGPLFLFPNFHLLGVGGDFQSYLGPDHKTCTRRKDQPCMAIHKP